MEKESIDAKLENYIFKYLFTIARGVKMSSADRVIHKFYILEIINLILREKNILQKCIFLKF